MKFVAKVVAAVYSVRIAFGVLLLAAVAAAAFVISRADFRENIFDLLPVHDGVVDAHVYAGTHFGQSNTLYFNVSVSDGAELSDAADALHAELKSLGVFSGIIYTSGMEDFFSGYGAMLRAYPYMFTEDDAGELDKLLSSESMEKRLEYFKRKLGGFEGAVYKKILTEDPLGVAALFYGKLRGSMGGIGLSNMSSGRILDGSGKNCMILAEGVFDSSDSAKSAEIVEQVEAAIARAKEKVPGLQVAYAGGYRISADNAAMARSDSTKCLMATMAIMVFLCLTAFRNRWYSLAAILPSAFGTAAAFCILTLVQAHVSTIAIAFASIAIGVSIDYAIHVLYRLDSKQKCSLADAQHTASSLAKPISVVAGTTMIAFVIMFFSGSAGFRQLGMFGAAGVLFSALASVFLLPAFAVGFSTKRKSARLFDIVSDKIESFSLGREKLLAIVALVIAFAAVPFAAKLRFDGSISSFNGLAEQTKADDALLRSVWGDALSRKIVIVRGADFKEVRERSQKLREYLDSRGVQASGLWTMLPSKAVAEENLARWNSYWSGEKISDVGNRAAESAAKIGFSKKMFSSALEDIKNAAEITANDMEKPPFSVMFKGRVSIEKDGAAMAAFVKLPPEISPADFSRDIFENVPGAAYIDMNFFGEHIADVALGWMFRYAAAAFALVALYLLVTLRRVSFVLAVLAPVAMGLLFCFAVMGACGIPINIINSVFVVFAVCLAQDYAVFMLYERTDKDLKDCALAAVLLSAFTTGAAFGVLAFAQHPVIRSLGLAAAISIVSILAAALLTVPFSAKIILKSDAKR